jgi:uncharacterized protein YxjI
MQIIEMELQALSGDRLPVRIVSDDTSIRVYPAGHEGSQSGSPVLLIKLSQGELLVQVFSNIIQEQPSHSIPMENSKTCFRSPKAASILQRIRDGQMDKIEEGECYHALSMLLNPFTNRTFNLKEVAALVEREYFHVRSLYALTQTYPKPRRQKTPSDPISKSAPNSETVITMTRNSPSTH